MRTARARPRQNGGRLGGRFAEKIVRRGALDDTPAIISTTSPPRRRASPRLCVAITTLMPRAVMSGIDVLDRLGRRRVEARGRLVEEQHIRVRGEGPRQGERAAVPRRRYCPGRRSRRSDRATFADADCARRSGRPAACQRIAQVGRGAPPEHHRPLEHDGAAIGRRIRRVRPSSTRRRWANEAHGEAQQGGLARAVRPDQRRSARRRRT